jgi:hypothetical protein
MNSRFAHLRSPTIFHPLLAFAVFLAILLAIYFYLEA